MWGGGQASFLRCSFTNNTLVPSWSGGGVLQATATDGHRSAQVRKGSLFLAPQQRTMKLDMTLRDRNAFYASVTSIDTDSQLMY